jgi:hypothetical protein
MGRDSSVGIASGYRLDYRGIGVRVPVGSRIFFSPRPERYWVQWAPRALSPGVKRQGLQADHSPLTSAEVKKNGSIHRLPHTPSWPSA